MEQANSVLQRILKTRMRQEDYSLLGESNIETMYSGWKKGSVVKCLPSIYNAPSFSQAQTFKPSIWEAEADEAL